MPFPNQVNVQPAPAVEGDFASSNPRFSYDAGQGGLVAGASGVTIGRFAWVSYAQVDNDNAPQVANNNGVGPVAGFVHREQQGLITTFLTENGMTIPLGLGVNLCTGGDFWAKNTGANIATPGMFAYANFATGAVTFAAANAPPTAVVTAAIAASTFSVTGSITGNVLTVTGVNSGTLVAGATIAGGATVAGTQIVSQLSGAVGGIGTYALSIPEQTVVSGTITGTYGTMTVSAVTSGVLIVGGAISGTSVVAGTQITQFLTGAGGIGTYAVNNNTVVSSTAITETLAAQTKWVALSAGANGELVKISDHPLG